MTDLTSSQPTLPATDYEKMIEQDFAEIRRLNALMQQDREEINRLKAEASRFKQEAERLRQETLTLPAELQATV